MRDCFLTEIEEGAEERHKLYFKGPRECVVKEEPSLSNFRTNLLNGVVYRVICHIILLFNYLGLSVQNK